MPTPLYQCIILGMPKPEQVEALSAAIALAMEDFGLKPGEHFTVIEGLTDAFVETVPAVAFFFSAASVLNCLSTPT